MFWSDLGYTSQDVNCHVTPNISLLQTVYQWQEFVEFQTDPYNLRTLLFLCIIVLFSTFHILSGFSTVPQFTEDSVTIRTLIPLSRSDPTDSPKGSQVLIRPGNSYLSKSFRCSSIHSKFRPLPWSVFPDLHPSTFHSSPHKSVTLINQPCF